MQCLGLDPSLSNFGWAIHDDEAVGAARCPQRGRFHTSNKTLFIDRYRDMRASVAKLLADTGAKRVGIEFPIFNDYFSEGMYGLFLFICEALREAKVDVVFLANNQTKEAAHRFLNRPKGWKMDKSDMVEAAKSDCGGKGRWSSDEADAYWAGRLATRFWSLLDGVIQEGDLTPSERRQFMLIRTFTKGKRAGDTVKSGILYREDERFFRWSGEEDGTQERNTPGNVHGDGGSPGDPGDSEPEQEGEAPGGEEGGQ